MYQQVEHIPQSHVINHFAFGRLPCTRHDEEGVVNSRLIEICDFVMEAVGRGEEQKEIRASLFCLHDHKGTLHVVSRRPLPEFCEVMFAVAWQVRANESMEAVEFHILTDEALTDLRNPENITAVWRGAISEV